MADVIVAPTRLIRLEDGCRAIAEAKTLAEAKNIRDAAQLMAYAIRERDLGQQAASDAAEIKVRAERRMGELLKEQQPKANRPRSHDGTLAAGPVLPQGITKTESSRCQTIAALPKEAFEKEITTHREAGRLTSSAVLKTAKTHKRKAEQNRKAKPAKAAKADSERFRVITGDCVLEMSKFPSRPRLIFADPPYNLGVDYGEGAAADSLPYDRFVKWQAGWVQAAAGLLADDGSLWVLMSDEYAAEVRLAIRAAGLHLRNWIKWKEGFGVNCSNKFNRCSRHLFYAVKSKSRFVFHPEAVKRPSDRQAVYGDARADPDGKILDDVWDDVPRLAGTHKERIPSFPTQLPVALVERVVRCASDGGDLILDPFSSSGTAGVAAVRAGRLYVGIEKNKNFARLSIARLKGECDG